MSKEDVKIRILKCEADPYFRCGPRTDDGNYVGICPTNRYCNPVNSSCQGIPVKSVYRECINDMDRQCIMPTNTEKTLGKYL